MEAQIVFGDQMMTVNLPDNVLSAPPGLSTTLSGVDDIEKTVRQAVLEVMKSQLKPRREIVPKKADILIYGIPNWSPYAAFSVMNPLLNLVSTGLGYFGGVIEAMGKPGCTVILASPCREEWNHDHHPTHKEIWDKILPKYRDPYKIADLFEEDFAHRPDYIYKYRYCYGFHPMHGLMTTYPLKRLRHAANIIVAWAENPVEIQRALGFETANTVEAAVEQAKALQGKDASSREIKPRD